MSMRTTDNLSSYVDTEELTSAILRRVRIDLIGRGKVTHGNIADLETGRSIYCKKIELVHEAGKRPSLVITCSPVEIHYNFDDVSAEIQTNDIAEERNMMSNPNGSTVRVSELNHEPCYICGKECEVMQSMMHAYADIKVCGDCMVEHLYPFIESKKSEIGGMAARSQPQHALPGCRAWIDYDAVTGSWLIYFDGKPIVSYANWMNDRFSTLHDCDSDVIVGVMIGNVKL